MTIRREDFTVAGVRIYCESAGPSSSTREPVLLLHGLGASAYSWRYLLPLMSERHRALAFDWPGFGRSEQPEDFDYSADGFSRHLIAFMDLLGIERAHLVGNSMGGLVSLWTVLHRPERVASMVLIGTPVYPENKPRLLWPLRWPLIGSLYERALGEWAVGFIAKSALQDHSLITPELIREYGLALRTRQGKRAVAQFIRNAVPPDPLGLIARYKDIRHPTLVIVGETDGVVGVPSAKRFSEEVPGARFLLLRGCSHAPQEEKPGPVAQAVLEFLG